ncbi:MAG: IMP dehydrogenase [Peredibacter sp.]|jgi:IMP dehydrogenase|nr:IMP dehydrogenase [Bdellovibrionota bacterium]
MALMFNGRDILKRDKGLTFDDVLLVPRHSQISSRRNTNLLSKVTKKVSLELPLITANMDTITETAMACAMAEMGGLGSLHRFYDTEGQVAMVKEIKAHHEKNGLKTPIAASIGVKEEGMRRGDALVDAGVEIITLDIAHGDSVMMLEVLEYMKKTHPHVEVIAGNVATTDGAARLISAGADSIKCGIGPGSMCTTRIITGHGVPQLTAIAMCVEAAAPHGVPVIADGGIKNSGDMVKALCAGASAIMVGSLVSGTLETPGEMKGGKKLYRGMASKSAQVSWRGELPQGMAAEGEATFVSCKGSVKDVMHEVAGGIRSGMTYLGVETVDQMLEAGLFMEMSASGMSESRPHGVN